MAGLMNETRRGDDFDVVHAQHLEDTLQELQAMVDEHQDALNKLLASQAINRQTQQMPATASLDVMKIAFNDLAATTPFLPHPDSVLPALLALRRTHQTVEETKACITTQEQTVEDTKNKLEEAKADFSNQQALAHSLRGRIQSLQNGLEDRMEMGPDDIARERIEELKQKKRNYDKETSKLMRSLKKFIGDHLAGMLAAEELGGPVVGDLMEVDQEDIAGGFNSQGRAKKTQAKNADGKRQQRIDEIWGPNREDEEEDGQGGGQNWNEITAAGQEMQDLTEELLNQLAESEGDSSAAYVQLPRESAAARFLVRAHVAQFHPKDSTRLRLIDFGRELDD
ncbi:hypothetical protein GGR57DRAFT_96986 [Xylariaceae sp. FL1272]|nr:hypothetical protein GGR57DRAFT_96986 [Xylariaceae sp. FL1272]